jgi:hypothetical protein
MEHKKLWIRWRRITMHENKKVACLKFHMYFDSHPCLETRKKVSIHLDSPILVWYIEKMKKNTLSCTKRGMGGARSMRCPVVLLSASSPLSHTTTSLHLLLLPPSCMMETRCEARRSLSSTGSEDIEGVKQGCEVCVVVFHLFRAISL